MPSGFCASTASATLAGIRSCDSPERTLRRRSCVTEFGSVRRAILPTAGHRFKRRNMRRSRLLLICSSSPADVCRAVAEQERCAAILRHRCDDLLCRRRQRHQMFTRHALAALLLDAGTVMVSPNFRPRQMRGLIEPQPGEQQHPVERTDRLFSFWARQSANNSGSGVGGCATTPDR